MFDCPYCHAPFATYSALLNHKRDGHPAEPWPGSHPMGRTDHVHFRGDEPHSHDPYVHPWGTHRAGEHNDGTH